ncbi:hypothetical protein AVXHC19_11270 [Acidovorax sacchari]
MRAWGRLLPVHWRAGACALSVQWLSVAFVAAVSLALSVWLARCMEPSGFGRHAYLLNLATLLALAQDAGLRTLVMRERGQRAVLRIAERLASRGFLRPWRAHGYGTTCPIRRGRVDRSTLSQTGAMPMQSLRRSEMPPLTRYQR